MVKDEANFSEDTTVVTSNLRHKVLPLHSTHPSPTSLRERNYRRSLDLPARLSAILDLLLFLFCFFVGRELDLLLFVLSEGRFGCLFMYIDS